MEQEFQTSLAKGLSSGSEGRPPGSEGRPLGSEGRPLGAEGRPLAGGPAIAQRLQSSGVSAIERAADLLVRVLESERPLALGELAAAAALPKSTASRLVGVLERAGLVAQEGARGRLRPGPVILRAAERGMLERNLVELAHESLQRLGEASGETINLAVPGRDGVEHLAQVDGRHFLGTGQWLGRIVDYHCTAVGKVFLAFGVGSARSPLVARTPRTITDPAALRAELQRVRRAGVATAVDELELGLAAIAAPVRGARGEVIAALSISGPTQRLSQRAIGKLKPILIGEALRLSGRLATNEQGERVA